MSATIVKVVIVGLVTVFSSIILKQVKPEIAILINIAGGILLVILIVDLLGGVFTNFYNIPEVLFHYRDHAENTSHKQESKMRQATFAIRNFVKNDNPRLYGDFLLKISYINRIKLFGFIPLFKIIKQTNRIKIYLFYFLY